MHHHPSQVCRQYEKPLVLQLCRLVRGFTHPASYFAGRDLGTRRAGANDGGSGDVGRGEGRQGNEEDLALFSVDEFSAEMVSCSYLRDACVRPLVDAYVVAAAPIAL